MRDRVTISGAGGRTAGACRPHDADGRRPARSGRRFNQGGGGTGMMVMSLIGTVAGVAGTSHMVKLMKDQNKQDAR